MIDEICAELKNYFTHDEDRLIGDWTIENNAFVPPVVFPTEYIRIVGSRLNDGVHKVSALTLKNETFHGAIWIMSPPAGFLKLVKEIEDWQAKYGGYSNPAMSPYNSESFGGYSYSKSAGSGSSLNGASATPSWQDAYASRLKRYRRIREL